MSKELFRSMVREGLMTLGRVGVRAVAQAGDSLLRDLGDVAETVSKKTKKARRKIADIPRERYADEEE